MMSKRAWWLLGSVESGTDAGGMKTGSEVRTGGGMNTGGGMSTGGGKKSGVGVGAE